MDSAREVYIGDVDNDHHSHYVMNNVTTSKYTILSFFPISVFEQFRRLGNLYFLLMGVLMLIGTYTDVFQTPLGAFSTLFPLSVVLAISMGQEAYADYKRHEDDKETNAKPAMILNSPDEESTWSDIRCGHIILVKNGQALPADMIILATSEVENSCYIETSPIDGETNLKLRKSPPLVDHFLSEHHVTNQSNREGSDDLPTRIRKPPPKLLSDAFELKCLVTCDLPNAHIHHFNGNISIPETPEESNDPKVWNILNKKPPLPLDTENLLLRGSLLRNTHWVIGCVIYTGHETKIMKNAHHTPSKMSQMDVLVNRAIYLIFLADLILVTISTLLLIDFEDQHFPQLSYLGYLDKDTDPGSLHIGNNALDWQTGPIGFLPSFLTFVVLYNNFIPISLYVTLEMVIFCLLYYINNDIKLYESERDIPAKARSSNITDLGQIQYIFSDKTGTLTENKMEFRRCIIKNNIYGGPLNTRKDETYDQDNDHGIDHGMRYLSINQLSKDLVDNSNDDIQWFFLIMSLCHSVVVEEKDDGELIYQAESPDEGALIKFSAKSGMTLLGKAANIIKLENKTNTKSTNTTSWTILALNKFDSDRKRMSVVVKSPGKGKYYLLCKGADSSMLNVARGNTNTNKTKQKENDILNSSLDTIDLDSEEKNNSKETNILSKTDSFDEHTLSKALKVFASEGLRTLVLGYKELSEDEVEAWLSKYEEAASSINNRDELLFKCSCDIERDLDIVGATAIEDKLQEGVPETIYDLSQAGIKLWVLTGDKKETAINIGFSCQVLRPSMDQYVIEGLDKERVLINLCKYYLKLVWTPNLGNVNKKEIVDNIDHQQNHFLNRTTDQEQKDRLALKYIIRTLGEEFVLNFQEAENISLTNLNVNIDTDETKLESNDDISSKTSLSKKYSSKYIDIENTGPRIDNTREKALILEGSGLHHLLGNSLLEYMMFQIAHHCNAVIACRVAPRQKALLVRMVHQYVYPRPVTLAIGDGANDVGMIQEAQVGIGISGLEGQQAVNASDFAISRFRFLKRLLLVHGRWNYRRVCAVILYSFFKNMVLVLTLFYFNIYNGYSGSTLFDDQLIGLYNFFLGLAIIGVGIFDKDVHDKFIMKNPSLYRSGRENLDFDIWTVVKWILTGLVHSVFIFFLSKASFVEKCKVNGNDIHTFGTIMFSVLIMAMNFKVLKSTRTFVVGNACICCEAKLLDESHVSSTHVKEYELGTFRRKKENSFQSKSSSRSLITEDLEDENNNCCACDNFGWTIFFWLGSVAFYFLVIIIYSYMLTFRPEYYNVGTTAMGLPIFWMQIILISFLTFLFDLGFTYAKNTLWPSEIRLGIEQNYLYNKKIK